ncbi:prepilin-type N-terminal cleavage/methylation domain-containing protein [Acetobacter sicerae]|uniref:prepilin-type N-terminal cleavage/methylation domain-containing protein n=1 Tax=Acetobacter sicerae TaxID=85325 RepID=UPI00156AE369|nr:prepilin-type N-terminal cleavage/methylation domain-containing protein [Acetobacter sicerae]NHN90757.1 prepilin-type N-terminal cleavage/methylation domain-containing protein [Acetobacter sicerae]
MRKASGRSFCEHERGFTLLEILIVLFILGLTTLLLVQRGPFRSPHADLAAAAGSFVRLARAGREIALSSGRPMHIRMSGEQHRIEVSSPAMAMLHDRLPACIRVAEATVRDGEASPDFLIQLDGNGLADRRLVRLRCENSQMVVSLDPLTGRIEAHEVR